MKNEKFTPPPHKEEEIVSLSPEARKQLPNFLCVGAVKSGTTTFSTMLRQHPQVFASEIKELHYFNQKEYNKNSNHSKYLRNFNDSEGYKIRVEFTASYHYFPEVPNRIFELLGKETKILIILRNPVDRAFSHYKMEYNMGSTKLSFEDCFQVEMADNIPENSMQAPYFQIGLYYNQVKRYLDLFPQTKIILFEDFMKNTDVMMKEIQEFLEIEDFTIPLSHENEQKNFKSVRFNSYIYRLTKFLTKYNLLRRNPLLKKIHNMITKANTDTTKPKEKIDPEFAKVLQDYYLEDICKLEKLIDRDLSHWKTKY